MVEITKVKPGTVRHRGFRIQIELLVVISREKEPHGVFDANSIEGGIDDSYATLIATFKSS